MNNLKNNVLATIAYYDVLDVPLNEEEVWRFLISFRHLGLENESPKKNSNVISCLDGLVRSGRLFCENGFYFLPDREYLVPLRFKREKIAKRKLRVARRAIWWLCFMPFIRAIFASGSLAMRNTDEQSDLDVLVVAKSGRIWTCRFFATLLLGILNLRRKPGYKVAPDKICFNHYITDCSLTINVPSVYNAQTYLNLKPLLLRDANIANRFKQENDWVLEYAAAWEPNPQLGSLASKWFSAARLGEFILGGWLGDKFERFVKNLQIEKIKARPIFDPRSGRVIYNDNVLEFHPDSPEVEIIKKFNARLIEIGLSDLAWEKSSIDRPNADIAFR